MSKKSFTYELKTHIFPNSPNQVKTLTCFEPTKLHQSLVCQLKTMLMKTMMASAKENKDIVNENKKKDNKEDKKEDTKIDAEMFITIVTLAAGQDEEFSSRFYDVFECLLLSSNICQTDKQIGLDKLVYDQFLMEDVDNLMGEYIVNFLTPSVILQTIK